MRSQHSRDAIISNNCLEPGSLETRILIVGAGRQPGLQGSTFAPLVPPEARTRAASEADRAFQVAKASLCFHSSSGLPLEAMGCKNLLAILPGSKLRTAPAPKGPDEVPRHVSTSPLRILQARGKERSDTAVTQLKSASGPLKQVLNILQEFTCNGYGKSKKL